ncbi:hypothetical protein [Polymorphobacter megasporae]|uniref:hypothetical protein n=1 Tax=Glacieibacterium megasporae TaxID=2835787 RepID=UPI001C1DF3CD|nr:hypothetical protein [Polymorphobacter megasporae]UAJ10628.1 hypothetical protein KTC28_02405 [Polymorphobacter megasporae]
MIYKIVLDFYQARLDVDQYAVSFSGSLSDCEAQTQDTGGFWPEPRDRYVQKSSEPKSLSGKSGNIYGLEAASDLMEPIPPMPGVRRLPTPSRLWHGVILGVCLAAAVAVLSRSASDDRS